MVDLFHIFDTSLDDDELLHEINKHIEGVDVILDTLFTYARVEERAGSMFQHYWTDPSHPETTIGFVNDAHTKSRYLYVQGPDQKLVFRLWNNLRVVLPVVEIAELVRAARDFEIDPGSLQRLALGLNGKVNEEARSIVLEALTSSRRDIRHSAATAALLLKWRSFLAPVRAAEARAADEDERAVMHHVAAQIDAHGIDDDALEPPGKPSP